MTDTNPAAFVPNTDDEPLVWCDKIGSWVAMREVRDHCPYWECCQQGRLNGEASRGSDK